jgi:hypothetical protein
MADSHRPDDFASLRAELAAQRARIAHLERRRRLPRQLLPIALAALLVALVPLATLAATPFNDLTGGVHDANIEAIYNAGITKGCDPGVSYCPRGNVTREEMASFLARTAGLGGNPPVANALTAQTAVNAANASTFGGQPPSAFLPAAGDTTLWYPGSMLQNQANSSNVVSAMSDGGGIVQLSANASTGIVMPLPRATAEHGRSLAVKSVRVCFKASFAGIGIKLTRLSVGERGENLLINDRSWRDSTDATCYELAPATPQMVAGQTTLFFAIENTSGAANSLVVYSVALTLTPVVGTP